MKIWTDTGYKKGTIQNVQNRLVLDDDDDDDDDEDHVNMILRRLLGMHLPHSLRDGCLDVCIFGMHFTINASYGNVVNAT